MQRKTWLFTLVFAGVLISALYVEALLLKDLRANTIAFEYVFIALFGLYLAAASIIFYKQLPQKQTLTIIIAVSIIIRLLMTLSVPTLSDDIYRYAWDGKIQTAGFNPYMHSPDDKALSGLRDKEVYAGIFEKKGSSIYPPVSQAFFFISALPDVRPVYALKLLLSLVDIASIVLLVFILKHLKMDPNRIVFYAWNPLVIFEISHSGHIDGLVVFFLLAAILLRLKDRGFSSGAFSGLAIGTKIFPAILLPALIKKRDFKIPAGIAVALGLAYLPYIKAGKTLLPLFASTSGPRFNAGLKYFLELFVGGQSPAFDAVYKYIVLAVIASAAVALYMRDEKDDRFVMDGCFLMSALYVVLLPFMAPWYLVFLIPFLAYRPSPAFLYLSGAVMLSYLFYATLPLHYPEWVRYAQYVPFFGILGFQGIRRMIRSLT
jgi:hypothetical protein